MMLICCFPSKGNGLWLYRSEVCEWHNDPFLVALDTISKVILPYLIIMTQKLEDKEAPLAHILNEPTEDQASGPGISKRWQNWLLSPALLNNTTQPSSGWENKGRDTEGEILSSLLWKRRPPSLEAKWRGRSKTITFWFWGHLTCQLDVTELQNLEA